MSIIAQAKLDEVRVAVNKIDAAVESVLDLAEREDQRYPTRRRLKELRRISRTLAQQETALQELFS